MKKGELNFKSFILNLSKNKFLCYLFIFLCLWLLLWVISFPVFSFFDFPISDWYNYHFYNCWAFLNDRMGQDFLAANNRTCLNPLIDLPEYLLLLKLKYHPYLFMFLTLFDNVCLLFILYKISDYIFIKANKITNFFRNLFCILYVAFSPVFFEQFSIDLNDTKIAVIFLLGFYILLKNLFLPYSKKRNAMICIAGLLFGAALGLKQTAVVNCIGILLTCIVLFKRINRPFVTIFYISAGIVFSFLLTNGFWMYKCYLYYHNPVFPYFNDIFKSEYADSVKLMDFLSMKPETILEYIFYPFIGKPYGKYFTFDYDFRYAVNFLSVLIISPIALISFKKKGTEFFLNLIKYDYLFLILIFTVISFYINISIFAVYRYIIASSILYGIIFLILIYLLFYKSSHRKFLISLIAIVSLILLYGCNIKDNIKEKFNNQNYMIKQLITLPENFGFEDNSYVIVLTETSSAFVVNQNSKVKYIGFAMPKDGFYDVNEMDKFYYSRLSFSEYIKKYCLNIFASDSKVYILYTDTYPSGLYKVLIEGINSIGEKYNRKVENCFNDYIYFMDNLINREVTVCEYNKKKI